MLVFVVFGLVYSCGAIVVFSCCSDSFHLEQFTSRSANCYSLPSGVHSTFEGPPVWLIGSASEHYL